MKKLISILLISMLLFGCSLDDGSDQNFTFESVAVESVELPPTFRFGETYQIKVIYKRPSTCHQFSNFFFESDENQRTIVVINSVLEGSDCTSLTDELDEAVFNFSVTGTETYVFRFWQGQDDNGNDMYFIIEIPVTN